MAQPRHNFSEMRHPEKPRKLKEKIHLVAQVALLFYITTHVHKIRNSAHKPPPCIGKPIMPKVRATCARPPKAPTLPGLEAEPKRNEQHPDGGWLPAWITEQLRANKTNAASRTARYHRCRKCKEIVITGLSHDTCAWTVTADPTPLHRKTELAAILTDRQTFQAVRDTTTGGYRLDYRNPGSAWTDKTPVIPQHRCGHRFPGFLEPPAQPNGETNGYPDTPPF